MIRIRATTGTKVGNSCGGEGSYLYTYVIMPCLLVIQ